MDNMYKIFKRRLMLLCMGILVVILAAIHTTVFVTSNKAIEENLETSANGVAVSIANSIMWNVDEYKSFLETMDVNSEYYKKMQTFFSDIKENSNIKYIYTIKRVDETISEYVLDAEPIGSPGYSRPGTRENDPEGQAAFSSGIPTGFETVKDEKWGWLLGAYAPIFDKDGEMLGLVGVNIDGSHLYAYLNKLHLTLLATYVFIVLLSYFSLSKYSIAILDPLLLDKLTGAYSKRYFEKFMQKGIANAIRHRTDFAILMLDLDHFKNINDTYGHMFGDTVLSSISDIVRKSLRPTDYFIRYGGEEFAVIIANTKVEHVVEAAERIRKTVEDSPIFNYEKNIPIKMTISIGVANFNNLGQNANELIENADKALYHAKITRNMVSLYDIGMKG